MSSVNTCTFVGNLGKDPELDYTANDLARVRVRIAVRERRKVGDTWVDDVTWVAGTAFGKRAEAMEKVLHKGDMISMSCSYNNSSKQQEDGTWKNWHNFLIRDWSLLHRVPRAEEELEESLDESWDGEIGF